MIMCEKKKKRRKKCGLERFVSDNFYIAIASESSIREYLKLIPHLFTRMIISHRTKELSILFKDLEKEKLYI